MLTIERIRNAIRAMEQQAPPDAYYIVVHPAWVWAAERGQAAWLGRWVGRHARARGVRGRKRALKRSWHPWHFPRAGSGRKLSDGIEIVEQAAIPILTTTQGANP